MIYALGSKQTPDGFGQVITTSPKRTLKLWTRCRVSGASGHSRRPVKPLLNPAQRVAGLAIALTTRTPETTLLFHLTVLDCHAPYRGFGQAVPRGALRLFAQPLCLSSPSGTCAAQTVGGRHQGKSSYQSAPTAIPASRDQLHEVRHQNCGSLPVKEHRLCSHAVSPHDHLIHRPSPVRVRFFTNGRMNCRACGFLRQTGCAIDSRVCSAIFN